MTTLDLLAELRRLDVNLRLDGDRLRFDAPPGVMTDALRSALKDRRGEILDWMRRASAADADADTIPRASREASLPASFAQRRMWFLQQLTPDSSLYNMSGAVRLAGRLDRAALVAALAEVQQRHEVLRTTFEARGDEPLQRVHDRPVAPLDTADLSALPDDARGNALDSMAAAWAREVFDLAAGPLFRSRLVRLSDQEHALLLAFHHSVCDGWSIGVFLRELTELYGAFVDGRPPRLPQLSIQYGDFAAWQRERLTADAIARDLAYWRRQLAGPLPVLELPADRARPDVPSFDGALHQFAVPAAVADRLEQTARAQGATLFMALLAAFNVLLFRYSGQRDLIVGSPIAGRDRPELEPLIGCFVNSLALRTAVRPEQTFETLVARVRDVCLEAFEHQQVPLERIIEDLRPDRDARFAPLYQVMFSLQSGASAQLRLPGLAVSPMEARGVTARFDLILSMTRTADGFGGVFEYNTALFEPDTIARLGRLFATLLAGLAASPSLAIGDVPLLSMDEREALLTGGTGAAGSDPAAASLGARFSAAVTRHAEAIALEDGTSRWTYAALGAEAAQLASVLRAAGVGPNVVVGVWQERNAGLLASLAGIALAGGAYLPLDPHQPASRAAEVLASANVRIVVTTEALEARVPKGMWTVLTREAVAAAPRTALEALAPVGSADDLAYVLFTSGSTGTPKGVAVPQRAVARLVAGTDYVALGPAAVIGQAATAAFDAATFEVWGAWLHGARLVVIPTDVAIAPAALGTYVRRTGVTTLFLTTALVHQIGREAPAALNGLDTLLFGGEAVEPRWVAAIQAAGGPRRILHVYGPTENTTFSTWFAVGPIAEPQVTIPIGGPIAQSSCYVVDAAESLVPLCVPGELLVGGTGLATGYLGGARLTAERFVPDSFSGAAGARLYRTGDIVRWTAPGVLTFSGRRDGQIKLRGNRIELGEVESAMRSVPGVAAAVALVQGTGEAQQLVAYVEPLPEATAGGTALTSAGVRNVLQTRLPAYMVPAQVGVLGRLPLNANGKVDRRALPPLDRRALDAGPVASPAGGLQGQIAAVWCHVLGLDTVGVDDSFFDVGGHSLLLVRVQAGLETALGRAIPLVTLFQYPTVATLAAHLGESSAPPVAPAPRARIAAEEPIAIIGLAGRFPGAPDVETLWASVRNGRELLHRFTAEELDAAGVPASLRSDARYIPVRGVLADVDQFDAGLFGLPPRDAALLDPQHRVLLECAWTALETAGYAPQTRRRERIGIWAGTSANTYVGQASRAALRAAGPLAVLVASDKDFLATRVGYTLDLGGPAVTVQTACSTSLVAVHLACQALRAGDCEVALAGGVSITVPAGGYMYQPEGIASPDGHCRPFDAAAAGTVAGNGVGIVVLKPLSAAVRDGDRIHAVIRGSAINNDGSDKVGFTAPSVNGQALAINAAQAAAGVTPDTIGYVEAHGTATSLGDPIEVAALRQVWGEGAGPATCGLASVKGSVGHLDAAAGVTGLMVAVKALQAGEVPATAHYETANPQLDLGPFVVSGAPRPWPQAGTRRAGVSSFGMGGTNAHVVLEEAPRTDTPAGVAVVTGESPRCHVVPVSGQTPAAVAAASTQLAEYLEAQGDLPLADVAHTQQVGRPALAVRRVAIGRDVAAVAAALRAASDATASSTPPVIWTCPGQGTQVLRMGEALYRRPGPFRDELDACAAVLQRQLGADLREILYPPPGQESLAVATLQTTTWTQTALVAVGLALAAQWRAWGITPAAVVGHSVGEITAAAIAGVLTREAALTLAAARGQAMAGAPPGGMLAIAAGIETVAPLLGDGLWLAAVNRATQCVVAGTEPALARAEAWCEAQGLRAQRLAAVGAFHSGLQSGAVAPLDAVARTLPHAAPRLPWISSLTGAVLTAAEASDPAYWGRQVIAPVRWAAAVEAAATQAGATAAWLELGPGHTLTHLVRGTVPAVATIAPLDGPDADATMAASLGALWIAGVTPDWNAVHAPARPRRVSLPTYPFQRQRYWLEPASADEGRGVSRLFQRREDRDAWYYRPSWRQATPLPGAAPDGPRAWILFADTVDVARDLRGWLEAAGHQSVVVEAGDRFELLEPASAAAPSHVVMRPDELGDYDALLRHVGAVHGGTFDIVHAWTVAPPASPVRDDGAVAAARRRGFDSLVLLARALTKVPATRIRVNVVTSGACAVTGAEELSAVVTTVLGPARVIPAELPGVTSTVIDLAWPADAAARRPHVERLAAELLRGPDLPVVAHRGAHRWVPVFEPVEVPAPEAGLARLRPSGVYLITGGLGDMGLSIAELLARRVQARLVLVGRTGLPPREAWDGHLAAGSQDPVARRIAAVRHLESLGAEVLVAAADVASIEQMSRVLDDVRARFGAVAGVVHAAGVAGAGMMALKTPGDATAVLSPKVNGTVVLDQLLARDRPDFVVLCSSLTALIGGAGQSDYCAANAFLDAYAQRRWCLGDDTVTSINWDTWREGGMAADAHVPADVAWRKALAIESGLTREEGQTAFLRALGARLPQIAVCTKDLEALAVAMAAPAASRAFDDEPVVVAHPRPALTTPYVAPERDSERRVCTAFERALGVARVGVHDNFFELGGHSLLAVDLMARLNQQFATTVPVAGLYEGLTPGRVAQLFERQVAPDAGEDAFASRRRDKGRRLAGARRRETRFERRQKS